MISLTPNGTPEETAGAYALLQVISDPKLAKSHLDMLSAKAQDAAAAQQAAGDQLAEARATQSDAAAKLAEAQRISDDFMKLWHEVLPRRFGIVETFNHNFPVRYSQPGFKTTLEIGAGLGEHLNYEKLTPDQEKNYYTLELRENMAAGRLTLSPETLAELGGIAAAAVAVDRILAATDRSLGVA